MGADVTKVGGAAGAGEPTKQGKGAPATERFQELMKIDKSGESDSEQRKKHKHAKDEEDEAASARKATTGTPVKQGKRLATDPSILAVDTRRSGQPISSSTPSLSTSPSSSATVGGFRASEIENFAWEEDQNVSYNKSRHPSLRSSKTDSPVVEEEGQTKHAPPGPTPLSRTYVALDPNTSETTPAAFDSRQPTDGSSRPPHPTESDRPTSTYPSHESVEQVDPREKRQKRVQPEERTSSDKEENRSDKITNKHRYKTAAARFSQPTQQKTKAFAEWMEEADVPTTPSTAKEIKRANKSTGPKQKQDLRPAPGRARPLSTTPIAQETVTPLQSTQDTRAIEKGPKKATFRGTESHKTRKISKKNTVRSTPTDTPVSGIPFTAHPVSAPLSQGVTVHHHLPGRRNKKFLHNPIPTASTSPTSAKTSPRSPISNHSTSIHQEPATILTHGETAPPGLPGGTIPVTSATQTSSTATNPFANLHPEVLLLLERMVGTMSIMHSTGLTETVMTLNARPFATSVFFGAQITIREYSTAPKEFNVEFSGTPQALELIQGNTADLLAALHGGNFAFRIHRFDIKLAGPERPLFHRKEPPKDQQQERQRG